MSEIETAVIATVLLLVCAACVFRLSRKSSDAPTNDLGQPLLGAHSADAHDTIRAHLAVSAAPPTNLRQWGMEDNSSSARVSTFRISSVTRATTMGGPPLAADRSFIPDEEAITFVNVRAIDYSNPLVQVVWLPLFDAAFLQPDRERAAELPLNIRPPEAPPTRMVWWVRRSNFKIRSDDAAVAQLLLSAPHTLADIAQLPFEFKNKWLRNELDQRTSTGIVNMTVSRGDNSADSAAALCDSTRSAFRQLLEECPDALAVMARKFQFAIHNETQFFQDVGGVTREVYAKTFETLFSEARGMFKLCEDGVTYEIDPLWQRDCLDSFYFVGLLMGKLMLDGLQTPAHLSLVLRKRLLNAPIKFQDLQDVDPELFNSLSWMLTNSIDGILEETFSVVAPDESVTELKPGGCGISVDDQNKIEFIQMRVKHTLVDRVAEPTSALREGLCDVIPPKLLSAFSCRELDFLLSGLGNIDLDDWQRHTVYKACSPSSPQVLWFWSVVERMSLSERAKLLQFATGSSNLPVEGFQGLRSARGVSRKFQVSLVVGGGGARLPQAHTCFNTIDLPDYATEEMLNRKLRQALDEGGEGFWIAE